jgi:hypothetical protein
MSTALTLTSASVPSTTFHAADSLSQVRVTGVYEGQIELQESIPGEDEWDTILTIRGTQGVVINTPDSAMDLRVKPLIQSGTAKFYFGP